MEFCECGKVGTLLSSFSQRAVNLRLKGFLGVFLQCLVSLVLSFRLGTKNTKSAKVCCTGFVVPCKTAVLNVPQLSCCNSYICVCRFTVHKEGPNKGRQFYSCCKPQSDTNRCKYFQWADENGHCGHDKPTGWIQ